MTRYTNTDGDGNYRVDGLLSGELRAVTVVADGFLTLTHYARAARSQPRARQLWAVSISQRD